MDRAPLLSVLVLSSRMRKLDVLGMPARRWQSFSTRSVESNEEAEHPEARAEFVGDAFSTRSVESNEEAEITTPGGTTGNNAFSTRSVESNEEAWTTL